MYIVHLLQHVTFQVVAQADVFQLQVRSVKLPEVDETISPTSRFVRRQWDGSIRIRIARRVGILETILAVVPHIALLAAEGRRHGTCYIGSTLEEHFQLCTFVRGTQCHTILGEWGRARQVGDVVVVYHTIAVEVVDLDGSRCIVAVEVQRRVIQFFPTSEQAGRFERVGIYYVRKLGALAHCVEGIRVPV